MTSPQLCTLSFMCNILTSSIAISAVQICVFSALAEVPDEGLDLAGVFETELVPEAGLSARCGLT